MIIIVIRVGFKCSKLDVSTKFAKNRFSDLRVEHMSSRPSFSNKYKLSSRVLFGQILDRLSYAIPFEKQPKK